MKWRTITNKGAEVGFMPVCNVSGSAFVEGQVVCWDMGGTHSDPDSKDGYTAVDPSGTNAALVIGLAAAATADNEKGLVQVYGPKSNAVAYRGGSASNDPMAIGDILDIVSASSCLRHAINGAAVLEGLDIPPAFVACESIASGAGSSASTTTMAIFIRCL